MCEGIGPTSKLPGTQYRVPEGATCDNHPNLQATHRVQGETDSQGAELLDMCPDCFAEYKAGVEKKAEELAECDWCGHMKSGLKPTRDLEEGLSGPVYDVCEECRAKR